jgi:hypothetical protein
LWFPAPFKDEDLPPLLPWGLQLEEHRRSLTEVSVSHMLGAVFGPSRDTLRRLLARSDAVDEPPRHESVTPGLSAAALFYLTTVGLAAAAIIAIFFGAGFMMLTPPGGTSPGPRTQPGSELGSWAYARLPASPGGHQSATVDQVSAKDGSEAVQTAATPPSAAEASANTAKDALSRRERAGTLMSRTAPAELSPSNVPGRPSKAPAALYTPANPAPSAAEIMGLLGRGDSFLRAGDIPSARAFYQRAADAGDTRAALRLGATFDPGFLVRARLGTMQADAAVARSWYSRALDLGAADAKSPLH